jgi:uncharacterized protein (DUF1697 family)
MPGVHVALLRGINVGGRTKVPMADLRSVMEDLGFGDVRTYIQSGNVVFSSTKSPSATAIERALEGAFGLEIAVMLRSASEMAGVVAANPFRDTSKVHVAFLAKAPPATVSLDPDRHRPETFSLAGTEVYFHLPDGMGRAKAPDYVSRQLKIPMTVRNWKTVSMLADMTAGRGR